MSLGMNLTSVDFVIFLIGTIAIFKVSQWIKATEQQKIGRLTINY